MKSLTLSWKAEIICSPLHVARFSAFLKCFHPSIYLWEKCTQGCVCSRCYSSRKSCYTTYHTQLLRHAALLYDKLKPLDYREGASSGISALSMRIPLVDAILVLEMKLETHKWNQRNTSWFKLLNRLLLYPPSLLNCSIEPSMCVITSSENRPWSFHCVSNDNLSSP